MSGPCAFRASRRASRTTATKADWRHSPTGRLPATDRHPAAFHRTTRVRDIYFAIFSRIRYRIGDLLAVCGHHAMISEMSLGKLTCLLIFISPLNASRLCAREFSDHECERRLVVRRNAGDQGDSNTGA